MPFLPFVLLLAWQALSRSASFALGWATAMYFGQIPGRQGRVLSVVSLVAVGWVIVLAGFALPLAAGAIADAVGLIGRNFSVEPIHVAGLAAAVVLAPPAVAAATTWAELGEERSVAAWLRLVPRSYPATASLGLAVLEMVLFTPLLAVQRLRHERVLLQVPFTGRDGGDQEAVRRTVEQALAGIGLDEVRTEESTGPRSWPLRTVAYAVRHLLGTVVRGDPLRMRAGELEIYTHASTVAVLGPKEAAYRARAAIEREVAFGPGYLTWDDEAQRFEDELRGLMEEAEEAHAGTGGAEPVVRRLDELQERIDEASLTSDEWNVLYRLRLQVETRALREASDSAEGRPEAEREAASVSGRRR